MATTDFINIRGQQNFDEEAVINPIETKIENDRIQNMFHKYKKTLLSSSSKGSFSRVQKKAARKKYL